MGNAKALACSLSKRARPATPVPVDPQSTLTGADISPPAADPQKTMLDRRDIESRGYKRLRLLAQGAMGEAWLCMASTGRPFVLKTLRKDRHPSGHGTLITMEADILFSLLLERDHFFVKGLWYTFRPSNGLAVVEIAMEYCAGGDLSDFFARVVMRRYRLTESFLWHVFLHLGAAVLYLHTGIAFDPATGDVSREEEPGWIPIIHRDIKADNILLRYGRRRRDMATAYPDLLLTDFGHAIALQPYKSHFDKLSEQPVLHASLPQPITVGPTASSSRCGTLPLNPPELNGGEWDQPVKGPDYRYPDPAPAHDIWQVGAVLLELSGGFALPRRWKRDAVRVRGRSPPFVELVRGLMGLGPDAMVSPDPSRRLTDARLLPELAAALRHRAAHLEAEAKAPSPSIFVAQPEPRYYG